MIGKSSLTTVFGIFCCLVSSIVCIYAFNGTGDSGDSIQHYLFARYAPKHPELYFDHWAKPLYVLLASPFAQFGFAGIKWLNVLLTFGTAVTTTLIAEKTGLQKSRWTFLFHYFAPFYFVLSFSGLTEYLFAFLLSVAILLSLNKRFFWSAVIVSFLPFVRSEGILFIAVFGLYFLWEKQWKIVPALAIGHVIYSIAGSFIYGDLLWVFTKIPYAKLASTYGHGTAFHFVGQLFYVLGVPLYLFMLIGLSVMICPFFRRKVNAELAILVLGGFLLFFLAHSIFWYFGIFNSMGLKRVFIAVMPLMSILSLYGFESTMRFIRQPMANKITGACILAFIGIFPFLDNHGSIHFDTEMVLRPDQVSANELSKTLLEKKIPGRLLYRHPYFSVSLDVDPFNKNRVEELEKASLGKLKDGDIIIWDNWFAVVEGGVNREQLDSNPQLAKTLEKTSSDGKSVFVAYEFHNR